MKIIHLASGDLWAGAEVQLFHLAVKLHELYGIHLLVVLLNHGQLEQELIEKGIAVTVLDESKLSGFSILLEFYHIVKLFQPDIVHTHRSKENVIGGIVARLNGKKSVRTVHGASEFSIRPFNLKRFVFDGADRLAGFFLQQKIISVSDELKQKMKKIYPDSKLAVIENCVDVEYIEKKSLKPCNHDIDKNNFNIAFIGRFVPVKRVDIFYSIAKSVISNSEHEMIHFHMIGDGPLKKNIDDMLLSDKLTKNIHLYGFIENTAPLLKNMNLLIFTSDHEGLPMTLLEAMTLGVPVLSRNLPSICEVLCSGECGYFIKSDNVSDYADIIEHIMTNGEEARNKIKMARQQITDKYNIDSNIKKYENLYKEVTGVEH